MPLFCRSGSCGNWRGFFSAWCPSRFFAHLLAGLALCQWWWVEILGFVFSPFRAPHCAFCTFESDLLFGLSVHSFFFSCSLVGCFSKNEKKTPIYIAISTSPIAPNSKCNNSYHIIRSCCCIVVDMIGPTTKLLQSSQLEEAFGECHSSFYN